MDGQKKFLEKCRLTKSVRASEDGRDQKRDLTPREKVIRDPTTVYYKCQSCRQVFNKPVQCIIHYWQFHACNECPSFPEGFNYGSIQNHHSKKHHCPYKYQTYSGYYNKFWAELALPSEDEADDFVCYQYETRSNSEVAADLRPILIYKCDPCDLTFENFSRLRVHVLCRHYCFGCSTYHQNEELLKDHHEKQHNNTFLCFRCKPKLKFESKCALVSHSLLKHYTKVAVTLENEVGEPCAVEHQPVLLQQHINRHVRAQSGARERKLWGSNDSFNIQALEKPPMMNIYQYTVELKQNLHWASSPCKGLSVRIELVGASNDADAKTDAWARQLQTQRQEATQPDDLRWLLTKHWRMISLRFQHLHGPPQEEIML